MQIYVNSQPLDYQLEESATLSEIITNVQEWAKKSDMFILDYNVIPEKEQLEKNLTSDDIDKLNIELGNSEDVILKSVLDLNHYIDKMGNFLAVNPHLEELSDENYSIINEGLKYIAEAIIQLKEKIRSEDSIAKAIDVLQKDPAELEIGEIIAALASARNHTMLWKKQYEYIRLSKKELTEKKDEFMAKLPGYISTLDDIAEDLTTGETLKAVTDLEKWMVYISEGLNILTITQTRLDKVEALMALLNSLTDALFENDLVTAADIVDFDIRDELESLLADSN